MRPCTANDLTDTSKAASDENSPIKLAPKDAKLKRLPVEEAITKFICLKDDQITLYGRKQTTEGNNLVITYERCNPKERYSCKSDEEFKTWVQNKIFVMFHNS